MLFFNKRKPIERILYKLFSCEISEQDAEQIIGILRYKKLYPLHKQQPSQTFASFLKEFWDWENSPYIKERLIHKHGIHKMYVKRCYGAIQNYWIPCFGEQILLEDVKRKEIQDFVLSFMRRTSPASAQARNDIIRSGTIALRWAFRNGLISSDLASGLTYYTGDQPDIPILSEDIVKELFARPWKHKKAMVANKLAMLTGLRSGEIQALRGCDIGQDCIFVRHSWTRLDGLKPPKNGSTRIVYVPFKELLEELRAMANGEENFVFHVKSPFCPIDAKCFLRELRHELQKMGVENKIVENIHFHSWRHYFTAHMKTSGKLEQHLLQRMTGHKSFSMMEYYSNHVLAQDADIIKNAMQSVFSPLVT